MNLNTVVLWAVAVAFLLCLILMWFPLSCRVRDLLVRLVMGIGIFSMAALLGQALSRSWT